MQPEGNRSVRPPFFCIQQKQLLAVPIYQQMPLHTCQRTGGFIQHRCTEALQLARTGFQRYRNYPVPQEKWGGEGKRNKSTVSNRNVNCYYLTIVFSPLGFYSLTEGFLPCKDNGYVLLSENLHFEYSDLLFNKCILKVHLYWGTNQYFSTITIHNNLSSQISK